MDEAVEFKKRIVSELNPVGRIELVIAERIASLSLSIDRQNSRREDEVEEELNKWWNTVRKVVEEKDGTKLMNVEDIEMYYLGDSELRMGIHLIDCIDEYSDCRVIDGKAAYSAVFNIASEAGVNTEYEDEQGDWVIIPGEHFGTTSSTALEVVSNGTTALALESGKQGVYNDEEASLNWTMGRFKACLSFIELESGQELSNLVERIEYYGGPDNDYYAREIEVKRRELKKKSAGMSLEYSKNDEMTMNALWSAHEKLNTLQERRRAKATIREVEVTVRRKPMITSGWEG